MRRVRSCFNLSVRVSLGFGQREPMWQVEPEQALSVTPAERFAVPIFSEQNKHRLRNCVMEIEVNLNEGLEGLGWPLEMGGIVEQRALANCLVEDLLLSHLDSLEKAQKAVRAQARK